jgi:hypothetical protein
MAQKDRNDHDGLKKLVGKRQQASYGAVQGSFEKSSLGQQFTIGLED